MTTFIFYLCPDYPMVPISLAIEVLETFNTVLGHKKYNWKFASLDGQAVRAANSIETPVQLSVEEIRKEILTGDRPDALMICSGVNVQSHCNRSLLACIRECARQKMLLGAISTGSRILAESGVLNGRRCVVHWEVMGQLKYEFPEVILLPGLYAIDGDFCTCAGGLSAMDMMLAMLEKDHDADVLQQVCNILPTDKIRSANQRQRLLKSDLATSDRFLNSVVELMCKNISEPLSIEQVAVLFKCSRRHIERKFESELDCSPARFYLSLRLEHADYLLRNTDIPISNVSDETGFQFFSHFSKAYKKVYRKTPKQVRNLVR